MMRKHMQTVWCTSLATKHCVKWFPMFYLNCESFQLWNSFQQQIKSMLFNSWYNCKFNLHHFNALSKYKWQQQKST